MDALANRAKFVVDVGVIKFTSTIETNYTTSFVQQQQQPLAFLSLPMYQG